MTIRIHLLQSYTTCSDRELLGAFAQSANPAAFTKVVRRYAGLAQRVAAEIHPSEAEDVAQATLILLGWKSSTLINRESATGWVFETARRLALKARAAAARRTEREAQADPPSPPSDPLDTLTLREMRTILAEELAQLPDEQRHPHVLCY